MSSWFSKFNPAPAFPAYTGPLQVGTVDVEIPASHLQSPSLTPESSPPTVAFRIFYPCEKQEVSARPVRWIPQPQRATVAAFGKFMGANSRFADILALFPHLIYYITIPAHRNAPLLQPPTSNKRWPVMFFSHGLAGSRNMYSHICGSLSSHGIIVIAMDHRDGSSPIQYIRATKDTEAHIVEPIKLSHTPSKEVYEARDKQLRIRMWEIAMAHTAMLSIDSGSTVENLDQNNSHSHKERVEVLHMFKNVLDIHEPGKISWAGHSFGACTMIQFLKSVYYHSKKPASARDTLFECSSHSAIAKQICSRSPLALLDLWALPLHSPSQSWLLDRPLPCYAHDGVGGKSIISILSQGFYKWSGNLNDVKRAICSPASYTGPAPSVFYPENSQHFSQSDFGILFPWITKRFAKAEEPERVLKLNMRAVLQTLRQCGIEIPNTSAEDMEMEAGQDRTGVGFEDSAILDPNGGVRGWISIAKEIQTTNKQVPTKSDDENVPSQQLENGQAIPV